VRDLQAAEESLCNSEQRLRGILEAAPVAFISVDADGLIVDWNGQAELVFGWGRSDALGRKLASTILPQLVRPAYEHEIADLRARKSHQDRSTRIELSAVHKDGREFPLDMTVSHISAGESDLFHLFGRDLSAQKEADDDRRYAEEQLAYQALHDPLTGLPNRTLLIDRIGHALALARRHGTTAALLCADIDNFKLVNDSLGHQAGDELLVQVVRRVQGVLRGSDTVARTGHDMLARVGGDELVFLCESLADESSAIDIAERISATLGEPFAVADERLFVTMSIGITLATPGATAGSLIRDADTAMHRAKERGGSRYELSDAETRLRVLNRLRTETELREALDRQQLRVFYQPIVSVQDESVVGAEALLRWEHPEHGLIPPAEFIPLAEETDLIVPFGRWVLEQASTQLAHWHATAGRWVPLRVSVNVSARQLTDDHLVHLIPELLKRHRVEPSQLILEITESVLLQETEERVAVLQQLRSLGVRLALDDFGTGYSSLSYLRRYPFDLLKLDRSFVSGLDTTATDLQIAAAVIEMGRALGMTVVAEGVETQEQLTCLRRLGCHFAQGYYFAKPMPADDPAFVLHRHSSNGSKPQGHLPPDHAPVT
jgi:diguanylate cyclase (GGDEF)-like protein/PAS domain S-box-containing protein